MRKIKRTFIILVCLLLAVVALVFTLENQQQIELSFLGYTSAALPLAFTVLAGFVVGAFLAGLTFWLPLGHYRRKSNKQAKQLAKLEARLVADKVKKDDVPGTGVVTADQVA